MKQARSFSVRVSLLASSVALVAMVALAVGIPFLSRFYLADMGLSGTQYTVQYATVIVLSYIGLLPVLAANVLLIDLLCTAGSCEVFTVRAVRRLRGISLCCFVELAPVIALYFFHGGVRRDDDSAGLCGGFSRRGAPCGRGCAGACRRAQGRE